MEKHNLKYTQFVGDRDKGTFVKVRDSCEKSFKCNYVVVKEECDVQKRMESGLRTLKRKRKDKKLSDGKDLGEKGRLTDNITDKM